MMPAAALMLEPELANVDTQGIGKPAGDKPPVTPITTVDVAFFPTEQGRDLAFGECEEFVDDGLRIERVQNFAEVALSTFLWRDAVEPRPRIEFRIAPKAFLPSRYAARDSDPAIPIGVEFCEP